MQHSISHTELLATGRTRSGPSFSLGLSSILQPMLTKYSLFAATDVVLIECLLPKT